MSQHHRHWVGGLERQAAGEQLEEDDTDRVQVRRLAECAAPGLLRRHVRSGPDRRPMTRERRFQCLVRNAEVCHPDDTVTTDKDVLRFDVAVNDAGGVDRGQASEDLARDLHGLCSGEATSRLQRVLQVLSRHILHGDKEGALVGAVIVDIHDVGMGDGRRDTGLSLEAGNKRGIRGVLRTENLERDDPPQGRVPTPVRHRIVAFANPLDNLVPPSNLLSFPCG